MLALCKVGRFAEAVTRSIARGTDPAICVLLLLVSALTTAGCAATSPPVLESRDILFAHAAVAADHPIASEAGLEMLRLGGNAVDAAVATSFCLSVVRPYSCGIGGGGFMLIHVPATNGSEARTIAINYRETAPAAVGPDYFIKLDDPTASRFGVHAVGVPGTVAGLAYALKTYGTLDLPTVLAPAIRAAEQGVPADANFVAAANELAQDFEKHPGQREKAAAIWRDLCRSGQVKVGDNIRQPQQAAALRLIALHGPDAFYRGEIAHAIVAAMNAHGGPITTDDLRNYKVVEMQPLRSDFRGHTILSMPPPSSGGIAMQQIFGILQRRWNDFAGLKHTSFPYVHLVTEATKHAFADRSRWLADPAFVDVPTGRLTSPEYLDQRAAAISMYETSGPQSYGSSEPAKDDAGTSHLCVVDAGGMAVACTETINLTFGSLISVPGFGFALNNEMDDFTTTPGQPNAFGLTQSDRNLPAAGKRPLSSMSPTIVLKGGKAVMVAGASGGPRIITGTTQCLLNCMLFDMTPVEAVAQPRFHHQWMPNVLQFEEGCVSQLTIDHLKAYGHETGSIAKVGEVQMIRVTQDGIRAASDPRKGGRPAGY